MQEASVILNLNGKKEALHLNFPSSWNELSRRQLLFIAEHWTSWQSLLKVGENLNKVRATLVIVLCGLKGRSERVKLCKTLALVNEDSGGNILECADFLFKSIDLTKNLLPSINVGWFKRYYGPADKLADISVEEFSFAFSLYAQYVRTGNENFLNQLAACLYRPANPDFKKTGETRVPFNNRLISLYESDFKKVPTPYKHGVYLFFLSCVEHLAKTFPLVFSRAENGGSGGSSFFDSVISLSGGKFGPFESTKNTNLYIICKELNQLIKDSKKK